MARRKTKSNLASVHERIVNLNKKDYNTKTLIEKDLYFNKKDLYTKNLKSYGSESFHEIDVKFEAYSTDATNVIISSGFSHFENNDYIVKPIALDNHQLFNFKCNFINCLKEINSEVDFKTELDNFIKLN